MVTFLRIRFSSIRTCLTAITASLSRTLQNSHLLPLGRAGNPVTVFLIISCLCPKGRREGRDRPELTERWQRVRWLTGGREERRNPHQVGFQPAANRKPTPFKLAHGGGGAVSCLSSRDLFCHVWRVTIPCKQHKTWMCQLGEGGVCNGGGSAGGAEFKRSSLSVITDHIRLFMASAHPSAPCSGITRPITRARIVSDRLLQHDSEHIVPRKHPHTHLISAQRNRTTTEHNYALKWDHQCGFFFFFFPLILSENFGEQSWTDWLTQHLCKRCVERTCSLAAASLAMFFLLAGLKAEDCGFFCGIRR